MSRVFNEEEGFKMLQVKVSTNERDLLEKLSRMLGVTMSMITRRLVHEELYYRGLIDDELI